MNEIMKADGADAMQITAPTPQTPLEMVSLAMQRGDGIEMVRELLALKKEWEADEARKAFDAAISAAKAEIQPITKNRSVQYSTDKGETSYRHEDMAQIAKSVDPILSENGLSYRYRTDQGDGGVIVTCILAHRDGHSEETTLRAAPDNSGGKNGIQGIGSAVTYLQRYTLKLALGLAASEDDDAVTAEGNKNITPDQFQILRDKMEKASADEAKMLKFLKVDHLEELPRSKFGAADAMLNQKIAEAGHA